MARQPEPQPQAHLAFRFPDDEAEPLVSWLSELCSAQSPSWPAGGEVADVAAGACAALRQRGIPQDEWLSELRGLEREGQLLSFLASPNASAKPPDDDDPDDDCATAGIVQLASKASLQTEPGNAALTPRFAHIDASDSSEHAYSEADNALILDAKARGLPVVRLNDVVLPGGKVLRFEVRFQTETSIAGSRRTEQTWGARGSPTGMAQVNIDNENTRMVESILPDSVSGSRKAVHPIMLTLHVHWLVI